MARGKTTRKCDQGAEKSAHRTYVPKAYEVPAVVSSKMLLVTVTQRATTVLVAVTVGSNRVAARAHNVPRDTPINDSGKNRQTMAAGHNTMAILAYSELFPAFVRLEPSQLVFRSVKVPAGTVPQANSGVARTVVSRSQKHSQ